MLLDVPDHSMYLQYLGNDKYQFYDPNNKEWHITYSAKQVAKNIMDEYGTDKIIMASQVFCLKKTKLNKDIKNFYNPSYGNYDRNTVIKNLKLCESQEEILKEALILNDVALLKDLLTQGYPETLTEQINNKKINISILLYESALYGHIKLFTFLTQKFSKVISSNSNVMNEAVEIASKYGYADIVQIALSMNMLSNKVMYQCLKTASEAGRLNVIQVLLKYYKFTKGKEQINNQPRRSQILYLFKSMLVSENLQAIKWFQNEYYNDIPLITENANS